MSFPYIIHVELGQKTYHVQFCACPILGPRHNACVPCVKKSERTAIAEGDFYSPTGSSMILGCFFLFPGVLSKSKRSYFFTLFFNLFFPLVPNWSTWMSETEEFSHCKQILGEISNENGSKNQQIHRVNRIFWKAWRRNGSRRHNFCPRRFLSLSMLDELDHITNVFLLFLLGLYIYILTFVFFLWLMLFLEKRCLARWILPSRVVLTSQIWSLGVGSGCFFFFF